MFNALSGFILFIVSNMLCGFKWFYYWFGNDNCPEF